MTDDNVISMQGAAAARKRRDELRTRMQAIDAEIRAIDEEAWHRSQAKSEEGERLDALARQMLDGQAPAIPVGSAQRRVDLVGEREILARAITMATDALTIEKRREANALAASLKPDHQKAVARIARALIELSRAVDEEERVRSRASGLAPLPNVTFVGVGSLKNPASPVSFWLKSARKRGLLAIPMAAE
jgi:hypothetical protein